jgi:hypothetical protein
MSLDFFPSGGGGGGGGGGHAKGPFGRFANVLLFPSGNCSLSLFFLSLFLSLSLSLSLFSLSSRAPFYCTSFALALFDLEKRWSTEDCDNFSLSAGKRGLLNAWTRWGIRTIFFSAQID